MTVRVLRVGTRGSALALWQAEHVRARLATTGYETERVEIKTTGDVVQEVPLARIGSRALFTKQIDDAMLAGTIDLAVHSLKDLPTRLPDGIALAAVGPREDPRDALVGRGPIRWDDLPPRATVATSSLRRRAQLLHWRPDLQVVDLRGNVDTRLAKLDARPEWAAIVLAAAGLVRLGLEHRIGERLPPALFLPAPGQGALAVTARADDADAIAVARDAVHDAGTAFAVAAERAFLRRLEGGCQVPVAAFAELRDAGAGRVLHLSGRVVSLGGERMVEGEEELKGDEISDGRVAGSGERRSAMAARADMRAHEHAAEALGVRLAERLLGEGAAVILDEVRSAAAPTVTEP